MATATATHGVTEEHIKRFETKLTAVQQAANVLPRDEYFTELFKIIHRPGWTTPAEGIFFEQMLETTLALTHQLTQLQRQLLAGAKAVGQ